MPGILSLTIIFFLIIDPLGTIPVYEAVVKDLSFQKRLRFTLIELAIAFIAMFTFIFLGQGLIYVLDISKTTAEISGGVLLFLISIKMIFSSEDNVTMWAKDRGYIVPVAIPLLAGPSLLAALTVYAKLGIPTSTIALAIFFAWTLSLIIYLFSHQIYVVIKDKGLLACQRLMGLLIGLVASQLFLEGVKDFLGKGS